MQKIKGEELLNEFLEDFIFQLGYDEITCFLNTDFCYYNSTKEIGYSLFESDTSGIGFIRFIRNNYTHIPPCSLFTFSLLHELGHYLTLDKFSQKEKYRYLIDSEKFAIEDNDTDEQKIEKQIKYSSLPIEKAATDMAMDILKTYKDLIADFEKELKLRILDFYLLNNVEITEEI